MEINISIIMPVYNGECFLKMTLDSLIEQKYEKCEIIIINDGSTDHSLEILEQYAVIDHRIRIINTENQGICKARNTGIKAAQGKYLMFCDHDDTYNAEYVQKAFGIVSKGNYDYVKFGCREITLRDEKVIKSNTIMLSNKEFFGKQSADILYEYINYHEYIWDGIYKKETIEKVKGFDSRFTAGCEDVDLFLKLVSNAKSCATVNWIAYNHFIRYKSSTSQKFSENSYNAVIEMYERKISLSEQNNTLYYDYCKIKTKEFLYTIITILAGATCKLCFKEVYHRLISLESNKKFEYYIKKTSVNSFDLKTCILLLYRWHCIHLLALICIIKRKL